MAKLVIFDTWIRNADRHHPDPNYEICSRDNIFFTPKGTKFELVAIDHSHCLVETSLASEISSNAIIEDNKIYGLFPEFFQYVTEPRVKSALARLGQIDITMAKKIVGSVPSEWGMTCTTRDALAHFIVARAAIVANVISEKWVVSPGFEFGE